MPDTHDAGRPQALLAEDDPFIRQVATVALERRGFIVTAVSDGAQALQLLQDWLPDVVILDGMMPNLDGLEACRRIRTNPLTAHLPVILLSARSQDADEEAALEAGAIGYIRKPFDALTLGTLVRQMVNAWQPA